jgi:hypothetical protein
VDRTFGVSLATAVLGVGLTAGSAFAGSKGETFTGEVSDAMCGAKHAMAGDNAACTRACVGKGSAYALVVGDKVYTLDAKDKSLEELNKLAGEKAKVTGTAKGDTIAVTSVAAAK